MKKRFLVLFSIAIVVLSAILVRQTIVLDKTTNDYEYSQASLAATSEDLNSTQSQLESTKSTLESTNSSLELTKSSLDSANRELSTAKNQLETSESNLVTTRSNLNKMETSLGDLQNNYTVLKSNYDRTITGYSYVLKDPTYQEMKTFIAADKTNLNRYDKDNYNCTDFAAEVKANAAKQNIRCGWVDIDFPDELGHAIVVFNTTDKGLVFIEPQDDFEINLQVGKNYWQSVVNGRFCKTIL